jgi:ribosomal protein S18 acetylase RimI-like enzyme
MKKVIKVNNDLQNVRIVRAEEKDYEMISEIGKKTYLESHAHTGSSGDISQYLKNQYGLEKIKRELSDKKNIFSLIFHNDKPSGFSKIIINAELPDVELKNITELDKLYLLKSAYGLGLGFELINYNIMISQTNHQSGMWLYAWKENLRAIEFYKKVGFEIIGHYDFKISETRSNPNHLMYLKYQ